MAISVEFAYTTGQTLTAQLFAIGSDVVVATASSVTEATNRKGRYLATFASAAAGGYLLVYFLGTSGVGSELVDFSGVDGEAALPRSEQKMRGTNDALRTGVHYTHTNDELGKSVTVIINETTTTTTTTTTTAA